MKLAVALGIILLLAGTRPARAQDEVAVPDTVAPQVSSLADLDAPQAVREGNRRLLDDQAALALEAYGHARKLEPDAREVDFVQGLANYHLGEFGRAREAFENAATSDNESLVNDAIYSIGTTYHADALRNLDNPQLALSNLESAMQRYRTVLANEPDHTIAGDANYKAASMWRTLKQQLQQQQQQSKDSCDNEQEQEQDQEQEQQQSQQEQNEQQEQQQEQEQGQQQEREQSEQQEQQQAQESKEEQEQQQQAEAREDQQEQVSREQAERKLREMMQALRDRKKERPEQTVPAKSVRVEKDW